MGKDIKPKRSGKVSQANEITDAAYSIGLQGKRVLWLCLMQSYQRKEGDEINPTFVINVADYQQVFGVSKVRASADTKAGADQLATSAITFYFAEGAYEQKKRPWLAEMGVKRGRGTWEITFNPLIMPFIQGLKEQFTTYSIFDCGKLPNVRAIRLYESLCRFRASGVWIVSISRFAEQLDLPQSQRRRYAEMKRTFIEPSLKRINETTPILAEFRRDGDNLVFTIIERDRDLE